jgi:hypothetical protein
MPAPARGHRCPLTRIEWGVQSSGGGVEQQRGPSTRGIDAPREDIEGLPRVIPVELQVHADPRRRASMPSLEDQRPIPYP